MANYILVLEVEPLSAEIFTEWGLHCTLVPWFEHDGELENLITILGSHFKKRKSVLLTSKGEAMFGKNHDLPVNLVEKTDELQDLHEKTIDILQGSGAIFGKSEYSRLFMYKKYQPHVTKHHGKELEMGSTFMSKAVYLAVALSEKPKQRKIVARIDLDGNETAA